MLSPLKENELGVSIILIPHNNAERFTTRMQRDILPTIQAHPLWKFQLILIDNSDEDKKQQCDYVEDNIEYSYTWPGSNIMYGPAMNMAVALCKHPYFIYACSNHGCMYDATWIDDLINPIIEDPKVAMTGSLYPSCNPADMGFSPHLSRVHIQGGVFGARTAAMAVNQYTTDERWKHWGSDIYQCFQLMSAGYELYHAATINSVWRQSVIMPERWKYVHDYAE